MPNYDVITPTATTDAVPQVNSLTLSDLKDALAKGLDDFNAMPTHVVFLCVMYPIIGMVLGRAYLGAELVPLLYPLATGFALIGPFAAIGLYELSRRREMGLDTSWKHAFDVVHSPSLVPLLELGALLLIIFAVWIGTADAIYTSYFGYREPESLTAFVRKVLTTESGHTLFLVGNTVGLLFAALAFVLSVISFPLLLDRNIGFAGAISTSVRVVLRNPLIMAVWAMIVALGLAIGALPLFVGLAVVIPVLGHATWHLYRKAVVPDPSPRPEYRPSLRRKRYAADFPASLFVPSTRIKRPLTSQRPPPPRQ